MPGADRGIANIIPGITVADPNASESNRVITIINTGLKPWQSDAFDLTLEHYFGQSGLASVGLFTKNVKNFFGGTRMPATPEFLEAQGLTDEYLDYDIVTQENVGRARISGLEASYRQNLTFLPHWARGVHVTVNGTLLDLSGPNTADFAGYSPGNLNWGVSLVRPRFLLRVNGGHSKQQRGNLLAASATIPAETYQYTPSRSALFLNWEFNLSRRLSLYGTISNLTGANQGDVLRFASNTPAHAKRFRTHNMGIDWIFGVKGRF